MKKTFFRAFFDFSKMLDYSTGRSALHLCSQNQYRVPNESLVILNIMGKVTLSAKLAIALP